MPLAGHLCGRPVWMPAKRKKVRQMFARAAHCEVTPRDRPVRLAGYASRQTPVSTILDSIEIAALLLEGGGERYCDAVVVVSAPADIQHARVLARPGMSEEKLGQILAKQMPDAEKRKRAHFVVDTSHGLDPVRARIRDILDQAAKIQPRRS